MLTKFASSILILKWYLVLKTNNQNFIEINASNLPKGLLFVQIKSKKQYCDKKDITSLRRHKMNYLEKYLLLFALVLLSSVSVKSQMIYDTLDLVEMEIISNQFENSSPLKTQSIGHTHKKRT